MPKVKTMESCKTFQKNRYWSVKENESFYKSHILTKEICKEKRNLRHAAMTDSTNAKVMKKILPYL